MTATYFRTEDAEVTISDVGRAKLASEKRLDHVISVHTAITIGSAFGLVIVFAGLVITHLWG